MYSFFRSSQAFTLMELMLVIAILMILFMVVSVPYGYYAERARVRDGASRIEQVWTLAHSSVQNGAVVAGKSTNANILIVFKSNSKTLSTYTVPLATKASDISISNLPNTIVLRDQIEFDAIRILSLKSGTTPLETIGYFIEAPSGKGTFLGNPTLSNIIVTVGYPNGTLSSGRAKEVKLEKSS